jgi:CRP/FNR family transcriptional regulator, cyclic AMP receptor protein
MPNKGGGDTEIRSALAFIGNFKRKSFDKGTIIDKSSEKDHSLYLIEAGRVVPYFVGPNGQGVSLSELKAGDIVGDMSAFGIVDPATYFEVTDDTVAFSLSRGQFFDSLRSVPEFAELVARALCLRLRIMERLYVESRLLPMRMRLYAELIRLGRRDAHGQLRISPAPTHAELARRIASQRETVTKQLSVLAKFNVIEASRDFIAIKDETYLRSEINRELGSLDY